MTRKNPNMSEKLAAALLIIQDLRGDPIPFEDAKRMSAEQICSLFQWDHSAGFVAHGADNHPTGLTPRFIAEHRKKTATVDVPAIRKCDRISKAHAFHRKIVEAKAGRGMNASDDNAQPPKKKPHWRSPGFAKGYRPLKSRSTFQRVEQ